MTEEGRTLSRPGTPGWRRAEAARLISFGRAAALPDGGFGWLSASGRIDMTSPARCMPPPA